MDIDKKISEFTDEMVKKGKMNAEEAKTLAKEYTEKGKDKITDLYGHASEKIASLAKEYIEKGKVVEDELEKKMEDLKKKAAEIKDETVDKIDDVIDELKKKKDELADKFKKIF
jgi:polyhydroxyalkanoate synthesis regulator phasin